MSTCTIDSVLPAPLASPAPLGRIAIADRASPRDVPTLAANRPGFPGPLGADATRRQDRIAASVATALAAAQPCRRPLERRRESRHPFPYPLHLTPYTADGRPDVARTFVVIGKHLAPHGLDFYSREPLAERRVIVSLDAGCEEWIGLVVELTWCRFSRHGWYDNGGRFVAVTPSPLIGSSDAPQRPSRSA